MHLEDKQGRMKIMQILVVLALLVPLALSFQGTGETYSVDKTTMGVGGITGSGTSYDSRLTTTPYQPGNYPAVSESGTANIGWFGQALNTAPSTVQVILNSTLGTNYTTEDLICYVNATDAEDSNLTAYYKWYNNSVEVLSGVSYNIETNNISLVSTLASGNTSKGEIWNCSILMNDGTVNETSWSSQTLTIRNKPPTHNTPVLNSTDPATNDTNQNLTVYPQNTSDVDSDSVKNITNWFVNSESITLLNMPFEGNLTAEAGTKVRDYSGYANNATVSGAVWNSTAGYDGKGAYEFEGSAYLDTGLPNGDSSRSYFAWIKRAETGTGWNFIIGDSTDSSVYFGLASPSRNLINRVHNGTTSWTCYGTSPIADTNWHHVGFTMNANGTHLVRTMYKDGVDVTGSCPVFGGGAGTFQLGELIGKYASGLNFNGTIDEVMIFNRSLSAEQVAALYNNKTDTIVSQETVLGETWQACVTPNDGTGDGITKCSNNLTIANTVPNTEEVILNSTSGTNYTTEDLSCYVNATDVDGDSLTAYYQWYNGGSLILSGSTSSIQPNTITLVTTLASSNTSKGETWNCSILVSDGTNNETSWNSALLTIKNTAPTHDTPYAAAHQPTGTTVDDNLISYWQFEHKDNKENKAFDALGRNNGTLSGPTHTDDGRIGSAYVFDGDYITMGNLGSLPEKGTIAFWMKSSEVINYRNALTTDYNGGNVAIRFEEASSGTFQVYVGNDSGTYNAAQYTANLKTDTWHHVVYTWDTSANTETGYLDGTQTFSNSHILWPSSITDLSVGTGFSTAAERQWNGSIDEVMIYNRTLSASEVLEMYLDAEINKSSSITTDQDIGASSNTTADADSENVTRIFNWYKNDISLTVLNLPFETNSSSTARDYSDYENNASIVGPTWTNEGRNGSTGAYVFNGLSDYVSVPYHTTLSPTTEITLEAWVKFGTTSNYQIVMMRGLDYELDVRSTGILRAGITNSTGTRITWDSAAGLSTDTWHHIAMTYNGSIIKTYANGEFVDSRNHVGPIRDTVTATGIGTYAGAYWFNGTMDEVKIFNHSLSPEQIKAHYNLEYNRIVSQETSRGEYWYAEITPNDMDTDTDGPTLKTNNVTINNSAPTAPTLYSPTDNSTITERFPAFVWNNSEDTESDTVTYHILVDDDSAFGSPILNITSLAETPIQTNYTSPVLFDVDTVYYWKVRGNDSTEYGSFSTTFNFTLSSLVQISLIVNSSDFGNMNITQTKNTTDNDPAPLIVQNDGNIFVNITINATDMWSSQVNPSSYYQWRSGVNETDSFNTTLSTSTFTNMSLESSGIVNLDWNNTKDTCEVDLLLTVPTAEPPGTKTSTITIEATG